MRRSPVYYLCSEVRSADHNLADSLALTLDVQAGSGLSHALTLQVEVLHGSIGVNSLDVLDTSLIESGENNLEVAIHIAAIATDSISIPKELIIVCGHLTRLILGFESNGIGDRPSIKV